MYSVPTAGGALGKFAKDKAGSVLQHCCIDDISAFNCLPRSCSQALNAFFGCHAAFYPLLDLTPLQRLQVAQLVDCWSATHRITVNV